MLVALAAVVLGGQATRPTAYPIQRSGLLFARSETSKTGECHSSWWLGHTDGSVEPLDMAEDGAAEVARLAPRGVAQVFLQGEMANGKFRVHRAALVSPALLTGPNADPQVKAEVPLMDRPEPSKRQKSEARLMSVENRKYLNLCVSFKDTRNAGYPHPIDWYARVFRNTFPGLDHYYTKNSNGRVTVAGNQLIGWLELPLNQSAYKSGGAWDVQKMITGAIGLIDDRVDFTTVWGINVFPNIDDNSGYSYATQARILSDESDWWRPVTSCNPWADQFVIVHEDGHNFGFDHSSIPGGIYVSDWSPMGNGGRYWSNLFEDLGMIAAHHNLYHKTLTGWILPEEVRTVPQGTAATFHIERTEDRTMAVANGARVYLPGYGSKFYTIEARRFSDYDNARSLHGEAVIIHYCDDSMAWSPGASRLIEKTPSNGGAGAMWLPGDVFTDATNGIRVKVVSKDATGFRISVSADDTGNRAGTVSNTNDSGPGSLREALRYAQDNPKTTIKFAIPKTDAGFNANTGAFTIKVSSALPSVSRAGVVIDGRTQTTLTGNSNVVGPEVFLDGGNIWWTEQGLDLEAPNCAVYGLGITNFNGSGIYVNGENSVVAGCQIGVAPDGVTATRIGRDAVTVTADGVKIGGTSSALRNVLASAGNGVNASFADNLLVQNNYIGLNVAGNGVLGISGNGVAVSDSTSAVIRGNYVGGAGIGIRLSGSGTTKPVVDSNYVGVLADKATTAANGVGIALSDGANNAVVGSTDTTLANYIAGNGTGIVLQSSSQLNKVLNNWIGTLPRKATGVGNGVGVSVASGASNSVIRGNVISGNSTFGVRIVGTTSVAGGTNTIVVDTNRIGVTSAGTGALGNGTGVSLEGGANLCTVKANVIGGSAAAGVVLKGEGTVQNTISDNFIGVAANGTTALGNKGAGVEISAGASENSVQTNQISANGGDGVSVTGGSTRANKFTKNTVGGLTSTSLGNRNGFYFAGTLPQSVTGNTVMYNKAAGVVVTGSATGVTIRGNSIDLNVGLGIDLDANGVTPNDALDADLGGNERTNFPTVLYRTTTAGQAIDLELYGKPNTQYIVELFSVPTAHSSGYGQGRTLLGFRAITTNANGYAKATNLTTLTAGTLTATATDLTTGSTSEFGPAVKLP